jgi:hypothetical protein
MDAPFDPDALINEMADAGQGGPSTAGASPTNSDPSGEPSVTTGVRVLRQRGFALCKPDPGTKSPTYPKWCTRSLEPGEFAPGDMVGILGGPLSDGNRPGHSTVILDLDADAALAIADDHLPPTGMADGRPSKPNSHRYVLVPNDTIPDWAISHAPQAAPAARQARGHAGPFKKAFHHRTTGKVVIDFIGTGGQVVCPPSLWTSADGTRTERREWVGGEPGEPAVVPFPELWLAVCRLAHACDCRMPSGLSWPWEPKTPPRPQAERGRRRPPGKDVVNRAIGYLDECPPSISGQGGHDALLWAARVVVWGFDLGPTLGFKILAEHFNPRCLDENGGHHPWSEQDLKRKCKEADTVPFDKPRGWLRDTPPPEAPEVRVTWQGRRIHPATPEREPDTAEADQAPAADSAAAPPADPPQDPPTTGAGPEPEDPGEPNGDAEPDPDVSEVPSDAAGEDKAEKRTGGKKKTRKEEAAEFAKELFKNTEELRRLADLSLDDPASYAAELAELVARGVRMGDFRKAIKSHIDEARAVRRAAVRPGADAGCPYVVRDGAIYFVSVSDEDGIKEVQLCNFTATITAELTRDDGAERKKFFTIEGTSEDGAPLPAIQVPAGEFADMEWVTEQWGNRAIPNAGRGVKDHLRAAIQKLSGKPVQQTEYGHTGWREIDGRWVFLHAGGGIGADGPVSGVRVVLANPLDQYVLPLPPTGDELKKAVRASLGLVNETLAPDRITMPLVGAVYRAPLGDIDFAVHLHGLTGVYKSELTALAQQHAGAGMDARHFPANWSSTANAIERTAFLTKDVPVVVDDFNPTGAGDPKKLHAVADRVFQSAGNAAGRGRLGADTSLRISCPPRGLILSTGEDLPDGHSALARVFAIEVEAGDVTPARLTTCQREARDGWYAQAYAGYVRWLAPQYPAIRSRLAAERAAARDRFRADGQHARTSAEAGDLYLGLTYMVRFASQVDAITPAEATDILARAADALAHQARGQGEPQAANNPVDQFVAFIPAILIGGQAHLMPTNGMPPTDHHEFLGWRKDDGYMWEPRGTRIGWVEDEIVYLEPNVAFTEVQRMATTQRRDIKMSPQTLWKRLKGRGLLARTDCRGKKERSTVRVTIAGNEVKVLEMRWDTFFPVRHTPAESAGVGATV